MLKRFILLSFAFLLSSCSVFLSNKVEVLNRSESTLTNVQLNFANRKFERKLLAPGERFVVSPYSDNDGGITLSYILDGQMVNHKLGFTTPLIPMSCKFEVLGREVSGDCHDLLS